MADWSMLPCDILGEIALKLDTIDEFIYFSTVCHSWNHASSIVKCQRNATKLMPWLLLAEPQNTKHNPSCLRKIYNLNNNKCYQLSMPETFGARCWGSSYGWLVMLTNDLQVQLFNPLTKELITSLPSIKDLPKWLFNPEEDDLDRYWRYNVLRFVLLKMPQTNDLVVAMFYDDIQNFLVVARPGDQSWTNIDHNLETVGSHGDFFYVVCPLGRLRYCDFRRIFDLEPVKLMDYVPAIRTDWISTDKIYLLHLGDDLLMIVRDKNNIDEDDEDEDEDEDEYEYEYEDEDEVEDETEDATLLPYYRTTKFDVFRVDSTNKKWVEVEDLGKFSIFVGCNSAMSVPISMATNLRRNCIYFTDDERDIWDRMPGSSGPDMGIYDMKTGKTENFYSGDDVISLFCPPFFFVPNN